MDDILELLKSTLDSVGINASGTLENDARALCQVFNRQRKGTPYPDDFEADKMSLGEAIRFVTVGAALEITSSSESGDGSCLWRFRLVEDMDVAKARVLREHPNLGMNGEDIEIAPKVSGLAVRGPLIVDGSLKILNLNETFMDVHFVDAINALVLHKRGIESPMIETNDVPEETDDDGEDTPVVPD